MGLDTSHDCWHGPYSAFNRWRNALAEAAGYRHYGGQTSIDWGCIEAMIGRELDGDWPRVPVRPDGTPDALMVLLAHSDCDGYIQTDMLLPLADRLEELFPRIDDEYHKTTSTFMAGLREAARRGERVEFH